MQRSNTDCITYGIDRWAAKANNVLYQIDVFLGLDPTEEAYKRQERVDEKLTLGVIDGCWNMTIIDNFRFIEALKRLAQTKQIKRTKKGWKITINEV